MQSEEDGEAESPFASADKERSCYMMAACVIRADSNLHDLKPRFQRGFVSGVHQGMTSGQKTT